MSAAVLEATGLTKVFVLRRRRRLTAVDGVTLRLAAGETLALVGESGSGKSTLANCILGLTEPTSGSLRLLGRETGRGSAAHDYQAVQMVFQDPNSSLNPRMTIGQSIAEPLRLHLGLRKTARGARITELLELVGLDPVLRHRYPHELSGGQRQRVGIARALAVGPSVLVLDEPTASLDVSVRGAVLDLLKRIQQELGIAYLFISHDMQAVHHMADRVAVMYLGAIIEEGKAETILRNPMHPYSRALLSAAPSTRPERKPPRLRLAGEIPSPIGLRDECRLAARCPFAVESCRDGVPPLIPIAPDHRSACPVLATAEGGDPHP